MNEERSLMTPRILGKELKLEMEYLARERARVREQRQTKFEDIIHALSKQGRHNEDTIFDCGKLGIVHIYQQGSWRGEWFELNSEFLLEEE